MSQNLNSTKKSSDEIIIFSAYSPPPSVKQKFTTKGRTKQSFKAECDINNIMARFLRTGVLEYTNKNEARYGDVTGFEYQSAMLRVAGAKTLFNGLPAKLRAEFDNDPARFLDYVQNPNNHAECVEMGLLKPEAKPQLEEDPSPTLHTQDTPHEPLRARDGTYRVHTRKEKAAEKAAKAAEPSEPPADKDQ